MHTERSGSVPSISEDTGENLEDARRLVRDLREKTRAQAQQLLAWRRAYKVQEVLISRLQREKSDQLKALSSKLLLFESRLIRKQKDISVMLNHREIVIHRQQRLIETLTNRLIDNGFEPPIADINELDSNLHDLDSLNDSDSAVVMEDLDDCHPLKYRDHSVARSISDAIDPNLKYTIRRSNGFLRRPEILETVYSVEEDADQDDGTRTEANRKRDAFASGSEKAVSEEKVEKTCVPPVWPYEILEKERYAPAYCPTCPSCTSCSSQNTERPDEKTNQVTTYNRVMSNHRSVTKPKDVKYKRINKAKSKSLEELRGRLKNWVEQGSKLTGLTLEHSQSYA